MLRRRLRLANHFHWKGFSGVCIIISVLSIIFGLQDSINSNHIKRQKQKSHTLANQSLIVSRQLTEDTIPKMGFGMTQQLSNPTSVILRSAGSVH